MLDNNYSNPISLISQWLNLHAIARENQSFFEGDKRGYISNKIYEEYTVNSNIIPNLNLNITQFLTVKKASFYDNPIIEEESGSTDFENFIDTDSLSNALSDTAISLILNKVGILYIKTGEDKLYFDSILIQDAFYDYNLDNVIVRLKPISPDVGDEVQLFEYAWYKKNNPNSYTMKVFSGKYDIKFTSNAFYTEYSFVNDPKCFIRSAEFSALPLVFVFDTNHRSVVRSNFVDIDTVANMLLGFGLANAPSSLLVKIFIKNGLNQISPNQSDFQRQFGDILEILGLGKDDDVGKVDTGDLTALTNFFIVLEKILVHTAQLEGMERTSFTMAQQTRQSGVSKIADNRSSGGFRNYQNRKINKFENNVFKAINTLLGKEFKFKNIDKSEFTSLTSSEILEYMNVAVSSGFEDYISGLAKVKKISIAEAEEFYKTMKKNFDEKYQPLISSGLAQEQTKVDGMYKGYNKLDSSKKNDIKLSEEDGESKDDNKARD